MQELARGVSKRPDTKFKLGGAVFMPARECRKELVGELVSTMSPASGNAAKDTWQSIRFSLFYL